MNDSRLSLPHKHISLHITCTGLICIQSNPVWKSAFLLFGAIFQRAVEAAIIELVNLGETAKHTCAIKSHGRPL